MTCTIKKKLPKVTLTAFKAICVIEATLALETGGFEA